MCGCVVVISTKTVRSRVLGIFASVSYRGVRNAIKQLRLGCPKGSITEKMVFLMVMPTDHTCFNM